MKTIKEISLKLKNRPGTLSEFCELLAANGISVLALTVRTDPQEGIVSFVPSDPSRAMNILESAGYAPSTREILAAEVPHHPGGFNTILKALKLAGVNLEYLYSFMGGYAAGDTGVILMGVDNLAGAHDALTKEWIRLHGVELYGF
jgi:hypothetical protein